MDINFLLSRKRREFGKPCPFTDVGPNLILEIDPNPAKSNEYNTVPSIDRDVDNSTRMCAHEANTESHPTECRGMNHVEGGWPGSVDCEDEDSVARFRKKFEKDKSYVNAVKSLAVFVETFAMENNSIDIYEDYFAEDKIGRATDFALRNLGVFRDLVGDYRSVVDVSWTADSRKFAAAYGLRQSHEIPVDAKLDSYVWDAENSVSPVCTLVPETSMTCVECSPADVNLLLSGSVTGQVALWDIRLSGRAQQLSDALKSHADEVTGIKWIVGTHDMGFYSSSTDGQILAWDARKLSSPAEIVKLVEDSPTIPGIDRNYNVSCVEYDMSVPYQFMVGTDQGVALSFNRKYIDQKDKLKAKYDCRGGSLLSVKRNAFFPQLFVTCDAWSVKLWSEEAVAQPVLDIVSSDGYFADVTWSPTRSSSMYAAKTSGVLEVWDLPGKNRGPLMAVKVSEDCLLKSSVSSSGGLISCGSLSGSIVLLKIPDYLRTSSDMENDLVKSCVKECDAVIGGEPRSERVLDSEEQASSGIEEWWDPPETAEDLSAEYNLLLKDFLSESRMESMEAVSNIYMPHVDDAGEEADFSNSEHEDEVLPSAVNISSVESEAMSSQDEDVAVASSETGSTSDVEEISQEDDEDVSSKSDENTF